VGTDTRGEDKRKIRIEQHAFMGSVWCRMALHHRLSPPDVLERVFAIAVWPYYLGAHFSSLAH
jgi:hypothetical protein